MIWVMFIVFVLCMMLAIPVGFSIAISATAFLVFDAGIPIFSVVQKMIDGINSFSYLALPLFVLSGAIMIYGATPRLMRFANMLLGNLPGGIGAAGCLGCGFFGAISGSGVATTASIGAIVGPEMVRQGYDKGFVASLLAASGTLGLVIPPSVCMVVYSQNASCSIGNMFLAGFIPGILAEILLAILSIYVAKRRNYQQVKVGVASAKEALTITLDAFLPLLMPVIILGGTMTGICTATESAAIATVYAFILAKFVYREMSWADFYHTLVDSAKSSASILFIIAASTPFGWVLTLENVTTTVSNAVFSVLQSPVLIYAAVVLILIILGTFMESFTIIILTTPIFLPIVTAIGVDPIAYGLVLMLCICIGGVTPPLAVCLFTACKIVKIRIEDSIPDVFMVLGILLFVTILLMIFPQLALFLPSIAGA